MSVYILWFSTWFAKLFYKFDKYEIVLLMCYNYVVSHFLRDLITLGPFCWICLAIFHEPNSFCINSNYMRFERLWPNWCCNYLKHIYHRKQNQRINTKNVKVIRTQYEIKNIIIEPFFFFLSKSMPWFIYIAMFNFC